ncbi:MAG: ComF family protein [Patescibacteria group bacterium]
MNLLETILNLVYPVNCVLCGKNGEDLCVECLAESPEAERECARWIFPLFDYRHPPVKKAVWLLKYKGKRGLAKIFAKVLYGRILEELADLEIFENFREPILIPIPLSTKRKNERGFNQAELICKNLINFEENNKINKNFTLETNILIKIKNNNEHQARITDRSKRLKNIIGSFAVQNLEKIKNRNIILIDDVTTTGATLNEAKKMLKQAGAKKVIAFTVAH